MSQSEDAETQNVINQVESNPLNDSQTSENLNHLSQLPSTQNVPQPQPSSQPISLTQIHQKPEETPSNNQTQTQNQPVPQKHLHLTSNISQQKQDSSSKKFQEPKEPTSELKEQTKKKEKQSKNVQITVKMYKKYLKVQTDHQNLKKQIDHIKQQYNKIAKDLISTQQESQKKTTQIKQFNTELRNTQEKLNLTQNQLKSTQNELKLRQQKLQKLDQDYANLSKKVKQDQKVSQKLAGLEQTIKELQKMLDESTKNQQVYQREVDKLREVLRIEKQMNSGLKSEIDELRHISSEHFSLKQEVGRLLLEIKSLRDAKEQYPIMVQKYEHSEQINEKLKESLRQLQTKNQQSKTMIEKLQKKIDKLTEQKRTIEKKIASTIAEKQERQGEIEAFKMQLEDQRTEIQVQRKRYNAVILILNQEIKDLKLALHHQHEKLKLTQIQLEESRKKEKKTVNLDGVKFSSLSKEDLFNLIQELEMKNASIKMNLNALLEDITLKDLKIKDLQANLMALTRHVVKALPNLDESEGMQYVQKEIIETGKGVKTDWPEIVQKVLVQNLRLKNSVTALGEEFNMRLRTQMQKNNK